MTSLNGHIVERMAIPSSHATRGLTAHAFLLDGTRGGWVLTAGCILTNATTAVEKLSAPQQYIKSSHKTHGVNVKVLYCFVK